MDQNNPFLSLQKGISVLLNVFHRADINGDGVLARDEFMDFFWDGILTEGELEELFSEFDSHNTGAVDAAELCAFLWRHVGSFSTVLAALEDLNSAVSFALSAWEQKYPSYSLQEQFVTRFMFRESQHQLARFSQLLDTAAAKLEEHVIPVIDRQSPPPYRAPKSTRVCPAVRPPVRIKRQMVTQTSVHLEEASHDLSTQVKKLERLVKQLENQPSFKKTKEPDVDVIEENLYFLVELRVNPDDEKLDQFKKALQTYIDEAKMEENCLYICVRWDSDLASYILYELWENGEAWCRHVRSDIYKSFQHQNVECQRKSDSLCSIELPASWWQL